MFELRKGMSFKATIIKDEPETVVAADKVTIGQAPVPTVFPLVGVLLVQPFEDRATAPSSQDTPATTVTVAESEEPAKVLPKTGSMLPFVGLLGALSVAASFGLAVIRKGVAS